MKWGKFVMAGAVISAAIGGFTLLRDTAPSPDGANAASAKELADVREEMARLRGQVSLSKTLLEARAGAAQTRANEATDESSDGSQGPEETLASRTPAPPGHPALAEIQETRLALFREEPVDTAWKQDAEVSARRQIVSGLPPEARAGNVECRSSMCRVEIVHQSADSYKAYVGKMLDNVEREWKGQVMGTIMEQRPNGSVVAEHYYVRPGSDPMTAVLAQHQADNE